MHLSTVCLIALSVLTIIVLPEAFAQGIDIKNTVLDKTSIIEVVNNSNEGVNIFRLWHDDTISFESFKAEQGWTGKKTNTGVLVFTNFEALQSKESVKFGFKTSEKSLLINWDAFDKDGNQVGIGTVTTTHTDVSVNGEPVNGEPVKNEPVDNEPIEIIIPSINDDSIFRIIPKEPKIGSPIRVIGDKFGISEEFDFYIGATKLGSFTTDETGSFLTTMQIPNEQLEERVEFKVKTKDGEEKMVSLRVSQPTTKPINGGIKLTIEGIPEVMHRGDKLTIYGTANPKSVVTAKVIDHNNEIVNTRAIDVDAQGNWKIDSPVIIPIDAVFGEYTAVISDGKNEITKKWVIETDKTIIIEPVKLRFEPNEVIKFKGTALPNKPLEVALENAQGLEIFSDRIIVNETGMVEIQYQNTQNLPEGTYTLIATQENAKEFIFIGLGHLPIVPITLKFDKLNYKTSEGAIVTFVGKPSGLIDLLILNSANIPVINETTIELHADGRRTIELDLTNYAVGAYTAIVSKGNSKSSEVFTVGFKTNTNEINISTTKTEYSQGESILILGGTGRHVLLYVSLIDPDGNQIKTKEVFSDNFGKISTSEFRIPFDGKIGEWAIDARNEGAFDIVKFGVVSHMENMTITVTDAASIYGDKTINIKVSSAQQTTRVEVKIISSEGKVVGEFSGITTKTGEWNSPATIPGHPEPGVYTIKAEVKVANRVNIAETTHIIQ